ncbi:FkbM family methyltransferase [Ruegeria sp. MALMAid1280]|uniref:FkbM family methyltransferase n=1 Tax=Ruegeria sp. MALMAid1280 TaxID=3411634 RepID=UPI003BA0FB40
MSYRTKNEKGLNVTKHLLKKGITFLGLEVNRKNRIDAVRKKIMTLENESSTSNLAVQQLQHEVDYLNGKLTEQTEKYLSTNREIFDLMDMALAASNCREISRAQLKQDIFVLLKKKFKKGGFFVEFGATNGLDLSNTFLLEKSFGWNGILAEPAPMWHEALKKNRDVSLDFDCVWRETGEILEFNMANEGELSTLNSFSDCDHHSETRKSGQIIQVKTVSLNDLLERHNAPRNIDYLSIDTEGSEYEILKHFDFSKYNIDIITCEHNFTKMGDDVFSLLSKHGYKRVFEGSSEWDHWYVKD